MGKWGQSSVEYVLIVGLILVILVPLFAYSINKVNSEIKVNQADDAVTTVANSADIVYSLGPGTKKFVQITIPGGVVSSLVNGTLVQLQMHIYGSTSDFYDTTIAPVSGELPIEKGTYTISIEALDDGTVRIGSYNDTTAPIVTFKSPNGTLEVQQITLSATTDESAHCRYDTADLPYTSMTRDFTGELLTHDYFIGTQSVGNYTYYVRCKDTSNNIMQSSAVISYTLIVNASSASKPLVLLEGPQNGTVTNFALVKFTYNVSSPIAGISSCTLRLVGSLDGGGSSDQSIVDSSVVENQSQSLSTALSKGNYTWWVNCTDNSASYNSNVSATRWVRVNSTQDESFITSCAGWCGYNGFGNGICENSVNKCDDNCGLPYSSSHDCYAGSSVSDSFCTGGAESDTCCCVV